MWFRSLIKFSKRFTKQKFLMRYPKNRKEQTRKKILAAAVRAFSKHGVKGIGIADIMKQAGLTQGAFSRHFTSKEHLLRAALDQGFKQTPFMPPKLSADPLETLIRLYLSPEHRDGVEKGCLASVLTAEIARHPRRTRQLFVTHLQKNFQEIAHKLPGPGTSLKQRQSMAVFALLVGALQMARVTKDTALSDQILEAGIEAAIKLISPVSSADQRRVLRAKPLG